MREITIKNNEAGQRLDKFLKKYLREAGNGFLYKMLRKKNITLNGKKAEGNEILAVGDQVKFFLSEETLDKFRGQPAGPGGYPASTGKQKRQPPGPETSAQESAAHQPRIHIPVLFENDQILLADKPAGLLTQKAEPGDYSLNEWLIDYLLFSGAISGQELATFRPSVCNRLDRNTSGLVICGKTLAGSQKMSELLRDRSLHKYYRLFVAGELKEDGLAESWLVKDEKSNQVKLFPTGHKMDKTTDGSQIRTGWRVLENFQDCTYLEAELFTGKTHQIRAQFAALGHPLIGDAKYGKKEINARFRKAGIHAQMLHAFRLEFPEMDGNFSDISGKTFLAPEPETFRRVRKLLVPLHQR